MRREVVISLIVAIVSVLAAVGVLAALTAAQFAATHPRVVDTAAPSARKLAAAAAAQVGVTVVYDAAYREIAYPDGDVPIDRGACSDVVVRAFRACGLDLQSEVHRDMAAHFSAYPKLWHLTRTDPNIDHRRVPNLRVFFTRRGRSLPVTAKPADYQPGDVVSWKIGDGGHIGVVTAKRSADGTRFLIAHNFGRGVQLQDVLFAWPITGHYRWW